MVKTDFVEIMLLIGAIAGVVVGLMEFMWGLKIYAILPLILAMLTFIASQVHVIAYKGE